MGKFYSFPSSILLSAMEKKTLTHRITLSNEIVLGILFQKLKMPIGTNNLDWDKPKETS